MRPYVELRDGEWRLDFDTWSMKELNVPSYPARRVYKHVAAELAWTARTILRAHGLPDDVNVSAKWRTHEWQVGRPSVADITLTVTVSRRAKAASAALADAFAKSLAARSVAEPVAHISWEGANS